MIASAASAQSAGRSFVVSMPYLSPSSAPEVPMVRMLITAQASSQVTITYNATGASEGFNVPAGSSVEKLIDTSLILLPSLEGAFSRTLTITGTTPIGVTMLIDRGNASEAYTAIPDSLLGTEYLALTGRGSDNGTFVAVVGVGAGTDVTITPTKKTRNGRLPGQPFTIRLGRGEVYQVLSEGVVDADLSGTSIVSTAPVAVISGSSCEDFMIGRLHACNPLIEEMPPVSAWGRTYVLGALMRQQAGYYRIMAYCKNTRITINGADIFLRNGEVLEAPMDDGFLLESSSPVLVAQMATSTSNGPSDRNVAFGDPSMAIMPGVTQWTRRVQVLSPGLAPRSADDRSFPVLWKHYAQIAVATADLPTLRVDGVAPTWARQMPVAGGYVVGSVDLGLGQHLVTSTGGSFSLMAYGYSAYDAYAYTPEIVHQTYRLKAADSILRFTCADTYDTTIVIANTGTDGVSIDEVIFAGDLAGRILSPATLPVTIPPGGSLSVTIRFTGISAGKNHGTVIVTGGICGERLLAIPTEIYTDMLVPTPAVDGTLDFGGVPPTVPYVDSVIVLYNAGNGPVTVNDPTIGSSRFSVISPVFPIVLPPKGAVRVVIRFRPVDANPETAKISFTTGNCVIPISVTLKGIRQSGAFVDASPPLVVRALCAPKGRDTLRFVVSNRGDLPMRVIDATLVGAAASEFRLLTDLTTSQIPAEGRRDALVEYTPAVIGQRPVWLRLVTDAVNRDTLLVPADVRNDTIAVGLDVGIIDFGTTALCDPAPVVTVTVTNAGTVDITPLKVAVGRPEKYALLPDASVRLGGRDTLRFRFQLMPDVAGRFTDSLRLFNAICPDTIVIPVVGLREAPAIGFARDTIDFGLLGWCDEKKELLVKLDNRGAAADTIGVHAFPTTPGLTVDLAPTPTPLPGGTSLTIAVRLARGSGQPIFDSLEVITRVCPRPLKLYIRASLEEERPDLSASSVDFGGVLAGTTASRSLWVRNGTSAPITLDPLALSGATPGTRVVSPTGSVTIPARDSVEVTLEYAPTSGADSLKGALDVAVVAPCALALTAEVTGDVRVDGRRIVLWWENADGRVGEMIPLRLRMKYERGEARADSIVLRTTLGLDASVLLPVDVQPLAPDLPARLTGNTVSGTERRVEVEIAGRLPEEGVIAELRGIGALGGAPGTALRVVAGSAHVAAVGDSIPVTDSTEGRLRLIDLCEEGGTRLVRDAGGLLMAVVGANPIRSATPVRLELVEAGRTRLRLSAADGRVVAVLLDGELAAGTHEALLDPGRLPSGLYWLTLETPTDALRRGVVIVR